ncbi:DUF2358 domain-containing protein [Anabaenopsis tanganyikae CS-531]|uniref:DUF2358 domain-containing protein n=2 Tax=Anabaenopsis TaxID=110103 RepID=A0ABT5AVP7_9CYAN|nr:MULTISPECIES: DUF2358 domain-containing protein [Anabaenopsis]MDB9541022.1 DUF2358 domain-containing protein [Anabaenopsis arnoldii]MDH6093460.1 DUF2358 domain-containing protein [Anabaenopsis arnoldii]MDH6104539.1 DUF2358 domain-containing protein [Anabaenopsis tanganyikae CS-531]
MDIIEILKQDYQRFPENQTYSIYAENVYFQDPLTKFRGVKRYEQMIKFIQKWFINPHMEVHKIQPLGDTIKTEWTLSWNTPVPWKPRIYISGWSELTLNSANLIISHIDYWHCSPIDVIKQHFYLSPAVKG